MKALVSFLFIFTISFSKVFTVTKNFTYVPTWESLDSRPLPKWYDEAKIGIIIHWGVYSVPAFGSEWFWSDWKSNNLAYVDYMKKNYPLDFSYKDFAKDFKAELFSPDKWADLFAQAGAKYVVLTAKHADGYTLWPSSYSPGWNSKNNGSRRDLLGDVAKAVRKRNIRFGLYYSLYEWFHPTYLSDEQNKFTTQKFVNNKMLPELKEVIESYNPDIVWAFRDGEATDEYFKSKDFLAWLYNQSPVRESVVVNDFWGSGTNYRHGGFYTCSHNCNTETLQRHKFEITVKTYKHSWGYIKDADIQDFLTPNELIKTLVETVSCGGNVAINIAPTKEGIIPPIYQERLLQLGAWLKVNGEGIYNTVPWEVQKDKSANVWYTASVKGDVVYAIMLEWPYSNILELGSVNELFTSKTKVQMGNVTLKWVIINNVKILVNGNGFKDTPWGWVLKITNFQ